MSGEAARTREMPEAGAVPLPQPAWFGFREIWTPGKYVLERSDTDAKGLADRVIGFVTLLFAVLLGLVAVMAVVLPLVGASDAVDGSFVVVMLAVGLGLTWIAERPVDELMAAATYWRLEITRDALVYVRWNTSLKPIQPLRAQFRVYSLEEARYCVTIWEGERDRGILFSDSGYLGFELRLEYATCADADRLVARLKYVIACLAQDGAYRSAGQVLPLAADEAVLGAEPKSGSDTSGKA